MLKYVLSHKGKAKKVNHGSYDEDATSYSKNSTSSYLFIDDNFGAAIM